MISYELAKQLKDAGFPQKNGKSHEAYYLNGGENTGLVDYDMYNDVDDDFRDGKLVYIPTLLELIEEICKNGGERYFRLVRDDDGWRARNLQIEGQHVDWSLTAEEAVINLYLKVTKNKA